MLFRNLSWGKGVGESLALSGTLSVAGTNVTASLTGLTATSTQINALVAAGVVVPKITAVVPVASFVDGGGVVGTFALTTAIPVGATVICSKVRAVTGFAGDTSAALTIGDGTDADRYNTSTIDVFSTAANGVATGAVSGVTYHAAAKFPTLTITSAADFTAVKTDGHGSVTVEVDYIA